MLKCILQEEAKEMLKDFPVVDISLAHSPPYKINDEPNSPSHQGLIAIRKYIEDKRPKYFLHGHIYPTEENIVEKYCDTNIIYVYQDKIIEV